MSTPHDEIPVGSAQELDELVRLRAELSYADWKAHPRFKKERVLRDAQRQWGVPEHEALFWSGLLPSSDDTPTEPPPAPSRCACGEPMPTVAFDPRDASEPAEVVRRRCPRMDWRCGRCGARAILYASVAHYIAGDW